MRVPDTILEYLFFGLLLFALYRLFQSKVREDSADVKSLNPIVLFVVCL